MTRRATARLAGATFLLYIATGLTSLALSNRAHGGDPGIAATLASIARHAPLVRVTAVLGLLMAVYALVLAVTLYALTRDQDKELALLGLSFRAGEGVMNLVSVGWTLALLWVATGAAGSPDAAANNALAGLLLDEAGLGVISAACFAIGSTLFSWLFLRARSIPAPLAWLGVVSSIGLVVLLPTQLGGLLGGPVTSLMWIPMAVFEVTLALWLLVKGVRVADAQAVAGMS